MTPAFDRDRKSFRTRFGNRVLAVAALAAAAASGLAAHDGGRAGERRDPGETRRLEASVERRADRIAGRIAEALELTAEQRAVFAALRAERREAARADGEAAREAGRALRELLESESPDARAIGERTIELHRLRARRDGARDDLRAELAQILTAEQLARLDAIEKLRPERGRRHERGPERGPGRARGLRRR